MIYINSFDSVENRERFMSAADANHYPQLAYAANATG